jgi:predicted dinucleotide-binding enzyme
MDIAVIGSGFIGGTLGRALARSGHSVTFGSRHPVDDDVAGDTTAVTSSVPDALAAAEVVILAVPGASVTELVEQNPGAFDGKLVIDATNKFGGEVANSRATMPEGVRYVRAFNTVGGENLADPVFPEGRADLFFSGPDDDRATVEAVIEGVGLRPVFVGPDQEQLVDCQARLWVALAMTQGRGRRLAFRLLEG